MEPDYKAMADTILTEVGTQLSNYLPSTRQAIVAAAQAVYDRGGNDVAVGLLTKRLQAEHGKRKSASEAKHTAGPWSLCTHLKSIEDDNDCSCGYRGVIFGPEHDVAMAICQPGHDPAPKGEEGTEPVRYPRDIEIANAHLISAAPDLLDALEEAANWDGYDEAGEPAVWLEKAMAAIAKAKGL